MNLYARLEILAHCQPDKLAIETADRKLTYAELDEVIRRIAGRLRAEGVGRGDVVGLRLRDTPEHLAALFACLKLGAVGLAIDWRTAKAEFLRILDQFKPKVCFIDGNVRPEFDTVYLKTEEAEQSEPDTTPYVDVTDEPMMYNLTSGTTGLPKAMVVTHENIYARSMSRSMAGVVLPEDRYLAALPFAYSAGRDHACNALLVGATLVLFRALYEPMELVEFVNDNNVTAMALSPNVTRSLTALETKGGPLMPKLRAFTSTTGKLQPEDRAAIRERVAPHLIDYYGSTGTGIMAYINTAEDGATNTAAGRPALGIEVQIVDDDGNVLSGETVGNIRVRGPGIALKAVGSVMSPTEGFRDGWYYPGDLGHFGTDGLLHLDGRIADLIKRGGLMVYAQEVEQALRRHPAVADAAVVGVPSEKLGQEVAAFVVRKGDVDAKELVRHCRGEIAPFKVPTIFEFPDDLPRNTNGKVVKAKLLEQFEKEPS
ncbi:Long-chain-fatty-acid-CoA ligase [Hartmannibacter diazotrophicus]|uniref:Long-chain-fatty-acid-CoA ligase n=1 Tax=Hartmannibacter diazotrophicus TaxID=1482074 RepID=A0A2C9DCE9_9HYPH|nr:class I adenylate-forming enzyme family protein [Hartmannibacter diazotrophicus]SON57994.1 Long-chain-fatty-acid-CoA ligase [Hartmannibacter diazotrophicus]